MNDYKTWQKARTRALAGRADRMRAYLAARTWVSDLQELSSPHAKHYRQASVNEMHDHLHRTMIDEVVRTFNTGDATFFRQFADVLERKVRPWCARRLWLAMQHRPRPDNKPVSFTGPELLDKAAADGITTNERQLRRDMTELGFKFRHARQ
jgi:hypothetical protein